MGQGDGAGQKHVHAAARTPNGKESPLQHYQTPSQHQ